MGRSKDHTSKPYKSWADKAKEGADTILDVAKYILAAVLGIALVFVIYSLATNNPHAKEYLLGWIIAVVVIMVAFLII